MPCHQHRQFTHAPRPAKIIWRPVNQELVRNCRKASDGIEEILIELVVRLKDARTIEKRDWIVKYTSQLGCITQSRAVQTRWDRAPRTDVHGRSDVQICVEGYVRYWQQPDHIKDNEQTKREDVDSSGLCMVELTDQGDVLLPAKHLP